MGSFYDYGNGKIFPMTFWSLYVTRRPRQITKQLAVTQAFLIMKTVLNNAGRVHKHHKLFQK